MDKWIFLHGCSNHITNSDFFFVRFRKKRVADFKAQCWIFLFFFSLKALEHKAPFNILSSL